MSTVFDQFRTVPLVEAIEANKKYEQKNIFLFERDALNVPPATVYVVDSVDDLTDEDIRQMVDASERNEYSSFYVGFAGFGQQGRVVGPAMYEGLWYYYFYIPFFLTTSEEEAKKLSERLEKCLSKERRKWSQYRAAKEVYDELPWYTRLFTEEPVKPA